MHSIKIQSTKCEYLFWLATQPKVHQIKMMGRFVHEKSATIVFISMPSSEIICPVLRIQQPFKVDRENIADYVFFQQFLYLRVIWRITIIESDSQIPSRLFLDSYYFLRFFLINSQRFFANNIIPFSHCTNDIIMMRSIY